MKRKKNKSIILKLIRDGLINLKLINGLIASGLDAHDYRISIGDAIFVLMGFKNNKIHDFIFDNVYLAISEKVKDIDFSVSMKKLNELSEMIYEELLFAKGICDIEDERVKDNTRKKDHKK